MSDPVIRDNMTGLEAAQQLPAFVLDENPDYEILHEEILTRLRVESQGIPMSTMQTVLIERIATKYVMLKYQENIGWRTASQEKDANTGWLDLVKEWNRLLAAGHEKLREELLKQMFEITQEAVTKIPDTETRQEVRRLLAERFAAIGY